MFLDNEYGHRRSCHIIKYLESKSVFALGQVVLEFLISVNFCIITNEMYLFEFAFNHTILNIMVPCSLRID